MVVCCSTFAKGAWTSAAASDCVKARGNQLPPWLAHLPTHLHAATVKGGGAVDAGEAAGTALVAVLRHLGLRSRSRAGWAVGTGSSSEQTAASCRAVTDVAWSAQCWTPGGSHPALMTHLLDGVTAVCGAGKMRRGGGQHRIASRGDQRTDGKRPSHCTTAPPCQSYPWAPTIAVKPRLQGRQNSSWCKTGWQAREWRRRRMAGGTNMHRAAPLPGTTLSATYIGAHHGDKQESAGDALGGGAGNATFAGRRAA